MERFAHGSEHASDKTHADIRSLILKTDSPKDKAMLLILLKISESLEHNMSMTQDVTVKFDDHLESYRKHELAESVMGGQIKMAWRVLTVILFAVQGIALYTLKSYVDDSKLVRNELNMVIKDISIIKDRDIVKGRNFGSD